jgi:hypothetical protein
MTPDWTQSTRALKAVVIILGVLIVGAATVVAYEIIRRAGSLGEDAPDSVVNISLPLAAGERVLGMTGDGDELSFLIEDAEGRQRVVTVDRRTGATLGVIEFDAQ